jgi:hypothetical protein
MELVIKQHKKDDVMDLIEKEYSLNKKSLKGFLVKKGLLVVSPFFIEIAKHVKKEFGNEAELELKVVSDPEADSEQIFIYVHCSDLPNEKISSKYDKVLNWFIKATKGIPPVINISPVYH